MSNRIINELETMSPAQLRRVMSACEARMLDLYSNARIPEFIVRKRDNGRPLRETIKHKNHASEDMFTSLCGIDLDTEWEDKTSSSCVTCRKCSDMLCLMENNHQQHFSEIDARREVASLQR